MVAFKPQLAGSQDITSHDDVTLKNTKQTVGGAYCILKILFFFFHLKKHNIMNIKCLIAVQLKQHRHVHIVISEISGLHLKNVKNLKNAEFLSPLVSFLLL